MNDILLSVDAFHQETIPLEPVREFAAKLKQLDVNLRVHPAWLVGREHDNPYNRRTGEILAKFQALGILPSSGNVILPRGNALKYLGDYYDLRKEYISPYEEDPADIHTICVAPNGDVLNGNIYTANILEILEKYAP